MLDPAALLNKRITNWAAGGCECDTEARNRLEIHGRSATLVGRPDPITRRDGEAAGFPVHRVVSQGWNSIRWPG